MEDTANPTAADTPVPMATDIPVPAAADIPVPAACDAGRGRRALGPGGGRPGAARSRRAGAAVLGALGLCAVSALGAAGCSSAPRPEPEAAPEAKPKLLFVEPEAPFIVDWDAGQIARLTTTLRGHDVGAIVVASRKGVLRILPDCWLSGVYVPTPIGMYRGTLQVRRGDSLDLTEGVRPDALQQIATSENVPGGALIDYRFVVVGRKDVSASRKSARFWELQERAPGACRGATHFVRAALTGAFERNDPPDALPGAPAPGDRTLRHGGDFTSCLTAGTAQSEACSAYLKIELSPIVAARVELRFVSFKLGGLSVPSVQFLFRGKGDYRAGTTPFTSASATADWSLPPAEITEDAPLIVEAIQASGGGSKVLATGEVTPSDLRKAVFDIDLRNPTTGAKVGTVHLAAAEPAPPAAAGSAPAPAPATAPVPGPGAAPAPGAAPGSTSKSPPTVVSIPVRIPTPAPTTSAAPSAAPATPSAPTTPPAPAPKP